MFDWLRRNQEARAEQVVTQEQADLMLSHGFGQGGMMNGAGFDGDCPMQGGDYQNSFRGGPAGMMGSGYGRGMMNGWGAGQVNP